MTERPAIGGIDYPRTSAEFRDWFPDDASCVEHLGRLRWPIGFSCPDCGREHAWRTGRSMWMCAACGRKTSVTSGTLFHRSHSPLSTWFAAAWFIASHKNGVSALGLQQALGLRSYETAWAWMQKFRRAMVPTNRERLAGLVELGDALVGGRSAGKNGGDKLIVMVAVEVGTPGKPGSFRLRLAERGDAAEILDFATSVVKPGSELVTSGDRLGAELSALGFAHTPAGTNGSDPAGSFAGTCRVSSALNSWIAATLHHRVSVEHLPYYLDEYDFRFNGRGSHAPGILFHRLLRQALTTNPHPLTSIYSK